MDDLVTWLRAQLGEDERLALAASPGPWKTNAEHDEVLAVDDERIADGFALNGSQLRATVDHIACWDPARVLDDVAAKRRLLDWLDAVDRFMDQDEMSWYRLGGAVDTDEARQALALPYADRPGYRDEWRPAQV